MFELALVVPDELSALTVLKVTGITLFWGPKSFPDSQNSKLAICILVAVRCWIGKTEGMKCSVSGEVNRVDVFLLYVIY